MQQELQHLWRLLKEQNIEPVFQLLSPNNNSQKGTEGMQTPQELKYECKGKLLLKYSEYKYGNTYGLLTTAQLERMLLIVFW